MGQKFGFLFVNILAGYPVAQKRTEKGNTKYKNCSDTEVLKNSRGKVCPYLGF
jgi:hypothetical protein